MQDRLVVALVRDLYFGVRLVSFVRALGYEYQKVETHADLIKTLHSTRPALIVIDLEHRPGALTQIVRQAGTARLIAFGPPHDIDSRRAAEAAGFDEVVVNIHFHRELRTLLARHLPAEVPPETNGASKRWRWPRLNR